MPTFRAMDPEAPHDSPRSTPARPGRRSRVFRAGVPLLALLAPVTGCGPGSPGASEPAAVREPPAGGTPRGGEELVRTLGCARCHDGVPDPGAPIIGPPLGPSAAHDPAFVLSYVLDPAADGVPATGPRMPVFPLSTAEALALALYLTGGREGGDGREASDRARRVTAEAERAYRRARDAHPEVDGEIGERVFTALNCGACHAHPDAATPWRNGPDLGREAERARPEWLAAWLRDPTALRPFGAHPGTGGRMPDFGLSLSEADSIAAFLAANAPAGAGATPATGAGVTDVRDARPGSSPRPLAAHARATAERLLRERLPCLGCHRLGEEGGRIAPDLSTVADRRPAAYIRAIVSAPAEAAPGTVMPRVPMTDDTRRLVTAYLLASGGDAGAPGAGATATAGGPGAARAGGGYLSLIDHAARPPTPRERGRAAVDTTPDATYARRCATCHGVDGGGDGFNARYLPATPTPHASAAHMSARPAATLFDGVFAGGRILGLSHRMPPFGESLSRERIWDLVAHMRTLCRCVGPAWSRDNGEVPAHVERAGAEARSGEGGPTDGGPR